MSVLQEIRTTNDQVLQKAVQRDQQTASSHNDDQNRMFEFDNRFIRQSFARKVLFVMTAQLIITIVIVAPLILIESMRRILNEDRTIFISSILIFWVLYAIIICSYGINRTWPQNYIMLTFLTVSLAIVIACTCAMMNFKDIIIGIALTAALCITLGGLASISAFDFTVLTGALSSFLFTLLVLIFLYFLVPSKVIIWSVLALGTILLIMYFIIDIQIIVQGKHRYTLTPEDYIAAATLLYVDVVYIFTFLIMVIFRKI